MENIKLQTYKSEDGLYISYDNEHSSYCSTIKNSSYRINKKEKENFEDTHSKHWIFIPNEYGVQSVEKLIKGRPINYRYILKENIKTPDGVFLPKSLSNEEVGACYDEEEYEWYWNNKECSWYGFERFYERVCDYEEDTWENIEFSVKHLGDIKKIDADRIKDVKYKVQRTEWENEGTTIYSISDICTYDELDEMLYSDLILHNRPCKIDSGISYKIIRQYIKDNINPKEAEITSDYNFCLTVKKRVHIKPYVQNIEIKKSNGKSYAKPKFRTKNVTYHLEEIFNIAPKPYHNYNVIREFEGDCLEDLCENIKLYLEELMEVINTPVSLCECCGGMGHIIKKHE